MSDIIKKESIPLDTPIEDLEYQLLTENNIDRLNEIIDIFNLNIKRKDIVRTSPGFAVGAGADSIGSLDAIAPAFQ